MAFRLIFSEEIEFLNEELNINIPFRKAFMDKMIIRAYDKFGREHKLYKLSCKNYELSIAKDYKCELKEDDFKSWDELVEDNLDRLKSLEKKALEDIQFYLDKYKKHLPTVLVSGGKDSAVVHHLVSSLIKEETVFSNTSNESHQTYYYVKENYPDVKIVNPKEGFYPYVKRTGLVPSKIVRACCNLLKERPILNGLDKCSKRIIFLGMRNAESVRRAGYNMEWRNKQWSKRDWFGVLPIINWEDKDVLLYLLWRKIPFNHLYKVGYGRVGCVCCSYRSQYELLLNKRFLPFYHDRWQNTLERDFLEFKKAPSLNCTLAEYLDGAWVGGMVRDEPTEEVLEEFSKNSNLDREISDRYFNKFCNECGKRLKKNDVALSMKLYGRNSKYKCINCLMKDFDLNKKDIEDLIKEFMADGCKLF